MHLVSGASAAVAVAADVEELAQKAVVQVYESAAAAGRL